MAGISLWVGWYGSLGTGGMAGIGLLVSDRFQYVYIYIHISHTRLEWLLLLLYAYIKHM